MIKKSSKSAKKLVFKNILGKFVGKNVLFIDTIIFFILWQTDIY